MISGDLLRGHLETMVLATLERGNAHGLAILRRLEVAGCGALRLKEGSLYPALHRLEASGEVASRRDGKRCVYSLTATGRRRLDAARVEWRRFTEVIGGVLAA
jgi:DNA-binding PadR family transcriptional regulator